MGTSVQILSDKVRLIASANTWIEGRAIEQLNKTATLTHMHQVAGMPDLHPGKGYPIGAAFFSVGHLYPALVGNDIGCGMGLWQTSLTSRKVNLDKLAKRLDRVEGPLDDSWHALIAQRKADKHINNDGFDSALGTIGGGNHFAEFQQMDQCYDQPTAEAAGLKQGRVLLLVHSGSRGLGQLILQRHVTAFNHDGLSEETQSISDYLSQHDEACRWAELNRELIARRFMDAVRAEGECLTDVNHNTVSPIELNGVTGWLHRKGATPSDQGLVMIPGSRGDYSYLVAPTDSADGLYSLAHGAGRKWQRSECKDRLSHRYRRADLERTSLGSRVICNDKALLYEEAPQAYKDCGSIIDDLEDAGLIRKVARMKPLLTFKTHGGCST